MPLTVSHAAAAWPISRALRRLPPAALVIGTMSPDFEYLLRLAPASYFSHTTAGLFVFCLPVSLAAWLVYAWLVRPACVTLLPEGMGHAIRRVPYRTDARRWAWAAVAAVVGAFTHLAWDSFTHQQGYFSSRFGALRAPAPWHALRWYQIAQHGSTFLGLLLLFLWARRTWNCFAPSERRFAAGQAKRLLASATLLLVASAIGAVLNGLRAWGGGAATVLAFAAVGGMDGAGIALVGLGLALR